jgi:hypothetical protein
MKRLSTDVNGNIKHSQLEGIQLLDARDFIVNRQQAIERSLESIYLHTGVMVKVAEIKWVHIPPTEELCGRIAPMVELAYKL